MKRSFLFISFLGWALTTLAQTVVERKANYRPQGRDFVCVNGQNRYTRALYGGHTVFRLETSDRPVFATFFKRNANMNISLRLRVGGSAVALDSTDYCEARYQAGRREYVVRDRRWNGGELRLAVVADADREGAVWQLSGSGFASPATLEAIIAPTRVQKFKRMGDMGKFEPDDCFEPVADRAKWQSVSLPVSAAAPCYLALDTTTLSVVPQQALGHRFQQADALRSKLVGQVVFNTPDPYLNTLGGAMVMAGDGAWDGETWLHGAIGWRSQLPGWRAAYMGDFLGFPDRQRSHFDAYARSQVTGVPVTKPHIMDEKNNLSRGAYEWGTPMYSDGYICRSPNNNRKFHHYDMNLVFIDELLWHFQFDADTTYMRSLWPVIRSHLAWEKRTWDPDGDHLYDAYCCIWASDALQYSSGAVTHSSAYNYRGNLLAARIAECIGEDPTPYRAEADAILRAMNERLWLSDEGHWAEYQDMMGHKLVHRNAALWSVYTPIDCGVGTPEQAFQATRYVDRMIPHIPFMFEGRRYATISTSDWAPYEWSLNNVAMAEVMHTVLAYYESGRPEEAMRLLKSNIIDFMYAGGSPGNFGQLSAFDRNTGEGYRDFSDVTGISSRALIQGLYGITPQALDGKCIIRPGFPADWDSASIHTPYMDYRFERRDGKDVYHIRQHFRRPLQIILRQNLGGGRYRDIVGTSDSVQILTAESVSLVAVEPENTPFEPQPAVATAFDAVDAKACRMVDMSRWFNANVTDIFRNKYLSPRSPYTTLCLPTQGIGDWCSTQRTADIDDSGLRTAAVGGKFTAAGVPLLTPQEGRNVVYTSLWDNYPDSVVIPLKGRAAHAYLLMCGSTNPMQYDVPNGAVRVTYTDGSSERVELRSPGNWCPIEQDFDDNGLAFRLPKPRPYRVALKTGAVSRTLAATFRMNTNSRWTDQPEDKKPVLNIPGGAAQMLDIPLNPKKRLKTLTLETIANDVVIGLMSVTLQR
ncbi:MAG: DUF4450 domain-containing protein [Prevotella sp.]|nr:DUF4450 domain-containing protein [Prevotella sp.]